LVAGREVSLPTIAIGSRGKCLLGACSARLKATASTRPVDAMQALDEVLPSVAVEKVGKGGYMVLRPDSGDPVEAVLMVRLCSW